jgi:hypothetical protein
LAKPASPPPADMPIEVTIGRPLKSEPFSTNASCTPHFTTEEAAEAIRHFRDLHNVRVK